MIGSSYNLSLKPRHIEDRNDILKCHPASYKRHYSKHRLRAMQSKRHLANIRQLQHEYYVIPFPQISNPTGPPEGDRDAREPFRRGFRMGLLNARLVNLRQKTPMVTKNARVRIY